MSMPNPYLHNPQLPGAPFRYPGSGPDAAVLFHGFTATCAEVEGLGRQLQQAGFTVQAPLLPGHGTQPGDLNRVRWQDWAKSAENAYQDLARRYRRVIVGGESNGGLLALYLAQQHPEIPAVLAYAPALLLPLKAWQRLQLRLMAPFIAVLPKGDLTGNQTWQGYRVNPLKGLLQLLHLQTVVRARLKRITQPTLILQGRQDRTIDPHSSEVVYARICSPVKELHWLEHSGHCVLLENERAESYRLTLEFLRRLGLGQS